MKNSICAIGLVLVTIVLASTVHGQELTIKQRILMPGPLNAEHAKFEQECEKCHTAFSKQDMSKQCLGCHEDIAGDRNSSSGFHGKGRLTIAAECNLCHTDHEGRESDILNFVPEQFNHADTRFPLHGAHTLLACENCHESGTKYREAKNTCVNCHRERDIHAGNLGEQCENCHTDVSWLERKPFDHNKTDFPLRGQHQDVACGSCHLGQQYQFANSDCVSCHRADDVHVNANGSQCADCHSERGWDQLSFDHSRTNFDLLGKHALLSCRACHAGDGDLGDPDPSKTPMECNACHKNDDLHAGRNGGDCESCHGFDAWDKVKFDHQQHTDFPLTGKHNQLVCTQCHGGSVHDNLPRDCAGCHRGDDVHNDNNMALCGTCHTTENWQTINYFDHDFSHFPLVGMHALVPCQSCHINNQFSLADSSCASCHRNDDAHSGGLGQQCQTCHTPNAWNIWQFDHLQQTGYALQGKHEQLACQSCHGPGSSPKQTPNLCGSCHRHEDIHNGEFGERCDRCHGTNNFFDLLIQ